MFLPFERRLKRLIDIVIAGGLLIFFSPLIAFVAIVIKIRIGSPVVFRQRRPGYKGQPFDVLKFRTMMRATEREGRPLLDDERMGRLGRMLRRTSLDELPQLWNVLKGDMSLVGPRPLLMEYLERYTQQQMRRHDVKPGITGLAQVSGRNNLPWEQRFDLDVWYVDHWSLWLDIRILAATLTNVVNGEGVSGQGVVTMTEFLGSKDADR